jgi:hypothetical protein
MALPRHLVDLSPAACPSNGQRIRRCTFRRLSRIEVGPDGSYEVSCLYPDRRMPLPIGDLLTSQGICATCMAGHIFRPDED